MRADKYFAEQFGSRTKAAEAIEKGLVLINGKPVKPKDEIKETDEITLLSTQDVFVSNGGYKLQRAVDELGFSPQGKVFVDIGASTGGFTQCLLKNGAKKVYAVDVGESLLHESLRFDERITQMENTNARYLTRADFSDAIDGVVTDVSFISLRFIFPVIKELLVDNGEAVVLIKPQFECEKRQDLGKSGIVSPALHSKIVEKVLSYAKESGLYPFAITNAPIRKGKNIEYVMLVKPSGIGSKNAAEILSEVKRIVKENKTERKTKNG